MSFDNHVDLGNILTLAGFIVTMYMFHKQNVKRLYRIDFKVGLMWREFANRFNLDEKLGDDDEKE